MWKTMRPAEKKVPKSALRPHNLFFNQHIFTLPKLLHSEQLICTIQSHTGGTARWCTFPIKDMQLNWVDSIRISTRLKRAPTSTPTQRPHQHQHANTQPAPSPTPLRTHQPHQEQQEQEQQEQEQEQQQQCMSVETSHQPPSLKLTLQ
jgi:hypothetical protein